MATNNGAQAKGSVEFGFSYYEDDPKKPVKRKAPAQRRKRVKRAALFTNQIKRQT